MAKNRDEILTILRNVATAGEGRLTQAAMDRLTTELVRAVVDIFGSPAVPPWTPPNVRARAKEKTKTLALNIPPRDSLRNSPSGNSSENPSVGGSGHLTFAAPAGGRLFSGGPAIQPPPGIGEREMVRWVIREGYKRLGKTVAFSTSTPHLKKHLGDVTRRVRECFKDGYTIEQLLQVAGLAAAERRERGNVKAVRWMGNLALLWRPTHVRNTLVIETNAHDLPVPKLRRASAMILRTGADRERWMAGLRERWGKGGDKNPPVGA